MLYKVMLPTLLAIAAAVSTEKAQPAIMPTAQAAEEAVTVVADRIMHKLEAVDKAADDVHKRVLQKLKDMDVQAEVMKKVKVMATTEESVWCYPVSDSSDKHDLLATGQCTFNTCQHKDCFTAFPTTCPGGAGQTDDEMNAICVFAKSSSGTSTSSSSSGSGSSSSSGGSSSSSSSSTGTPTTTSTTSSSGGNPCFAKDSTTVCLLASPHADCEHVLMADLVPGDLVLGRDGATTVIANQHKSVDTLAKMLTFHTADGEVSMTPNHGVFVDGELVTAADAKVGSFLSTGAITRITSGEANIINAVTADGTIVADGVLAASNPYWIASLTVDAPLTRAVVNAILYAAGDVDSIAAGGAKITAMLAGAALAAKTFRSRKASA